MSDVHCPQRRLYDLMPPENFGVFAPVFESAHGYLALLHLHADDTLSKVRLVRDCGAAPAAREDILRLLAEPNWRPVLVATVAAFFVPPDAEILARLWHRIDTGSWVVPQIAVALSKLDPDFESQCQRRLKAHCPVDGSMLRAMTAVERHSAEGPADEMGRSAKAASTLAWLAARVEPPPAWLEAVVTSPEHQALVARDEDGSQSIAEGWRDRMMVILNDLSGGTD